MTLDTAIQNMIFKSTNQELKRLANQASAHRDSTLKKYQSTYGWTLEECEEFLDNVTLAYELLVNDNPS